MDFRPKLSWDSGFSPVRNQEIIRLELGAASRQEYKEINGAHYMQGICHQLWEDPQINWDGKVLGCCHNFWGDFGGNVFSDGLIECLNTEKIRYARAMLTGRKSAREDIPCASCEIYSGMKKEDKWLKSDKKEFLVSLVPHVVKGIIRRVLYPKL
jgi:hypothetical protein